MKNYSYFFKLIPLLLYGPVDKVYYVLVPGSEVDAVHELVPHTGLPTNHQLFLINKQDMRMDRQNIKTKNNCLLVTLSGKD